MALLTIEETRRCNLLTLQQLATYFRVPVEELSRLYDELLEDQPFLEGLNMRLQRARALGYTKGLFRHERLSSIDWFASQRVVLYVLTRLLRPSLCVETGVLYGGNTAFLLNGLHRNGTGRLISVDLLAASVPVTSTQPRHSLVGDSEVLPDGLAVGFLIPDYLKKQWDLRPGDSLQVLRKLEGPYELFCHDSEHSQAFVLEELGLARQRLTSHGVILVDDIDWSNGFFEFCVRHKLHPLCLTDNGKDGLRVRTGVVRLDHPFNGLVETTGR